MEELLERSPASPDADPGAGTSRAGGPEPHKWWTLVAVCLGTFMLLLDVTIVNVALPDIQTALHVAASPTCSGSSTPTR